MGEKSVSWTFLGKPVPCPQPDVSGSIPYSYVFSVHHVHQHSEDRDKVVYSLTFLLPFQFTRARYKPLIIRKYGKYSLLHLLSTNNHLSPGVGVASRHQDDFSVFRL